MEWLSLLIAFGLGAFVALFVLWLMIITTKMYH